MFRFLKFGSWKYKNIFIFLFPSYVLCPFFSLLPMTLYNVSKCTLMCQKAPKDRICGWLWGQVMWYHYPIHRQKRLTTGWGIIHRQLVVATVYATVHATLEIFPIVFEQWLEHCSMLADNNGDKRTAGESPNRSCFSFSF